MNFNLAAFWEAIKEPLRWFVCMVLAYAVDLLISVIPGMSEGLSGWLHLDPTLVTGVLTFIFRAVDKYTHEINKERTEPVLFKTGLLPF